MFSRGSSFRLLSEIWQMRDFSSRRLAPEGVAGAFGRDRPTDAPSRAAAEIQ
jgi:hypothetical protein